MQTTYPELARLSGLSQNGKNYRQIYDAIDRLMDLMIETNSVWVEEKGTYVREATLYMIGAQSYLGPPFDNAKEVHLPKPGEIDKDDEVRVAWTPEFYDLMQYWSKPVNVENLNKLSKPIARRLYRLADIGFFQQGHFLEDLYILGQVQLGLSDSRTSASKIKQSLRRSVESLEDKGLAKIMYVSDDSLRSGEGILVRPGPKTFDLEMDMKDPRYWATQLAIRGVQNRADDPVQQCRTLVDERPLPFVKECIRGYDIRRQGDRDMNTVEGPGWLYDALTEKFEFDPHSPSPNEPHISPAGSGEAVEQTTPVSTLFEPGKKNSPEFERRIHDYIYMDNDIKVGEIKDRAREIMSEDLGGGMGAWLARREETTEAQEVMEEPYIVAAYLEEYGFQSLPEHIRAVAPQDLSYLEEEGA